MILDMNNLQQDLKQLNEVDFDAFFHARVMSKLENGSNIIFGALGWKVLVPALSLLLFCFSMVYFQEGSLSMDSILGLQDANTITDYLIYY